MAAAQTANSPKVSYGWWVVAASMPGIANGTGQFAFGSLGLVMVRLTGEFGWDRAQISLALTLFTICTAVSIPIAGATVFDDDVDIPDLEDVWWAYLTRGRADKRAFILDDIPVFYRDPHMDYWGRLAIDATMPIDRRDEFERKRIPGTGRIDLDHQLK